MRKVILKRKQNEFVKTEVAPFKKQKTKHQHCVTVQPPAGRSDRQMRQELGKINTVVIENCDNLAPYQFLTAFSQLISRVCHSSNEVFNVLMTIVAKVLLAYPQQAMWLMTAVSKVCLVIRRLKIVNSSQNLIFMFVLNSV